MAKISARRLASIAAHGKPRRYGDGDRLYFSKAKSGTCSWVFLYTWLGSLVEMGLGAWPGLLAPEARALRDKWAAVLRSGRNPIEVRRAGEASVPTFWDCALQLIAAKAPGWKGSKNEQQWRGSLRDHAKPLHNLQINKVDTEAVLRALQPIWQKLPETAMRVRRRIEAVLDFAKTRGWREDENCARWRGHLSHMLAKRDPNGRRHHSALPFAHMADFMRQLRELRSMAAAALELLVLTVVRSNELRGARWNEFDLATATWIVPSSRMKGNREHRVALSSRAVRVLESLPRSGELVFPGLAVNAFENVIERIGIENATPHGFRSSFSDWLNDATSFDPQLGEEAMAHLIGSSARRAYRRGDGLEKRRTVMEAWAVHCEHVDNVVVTFPRTGS